jgi:hypothetical protein
MLWSGKAFTIDIGSLPMELGLSSGRPRIGVRFWMSAWILRVIGVVYDFGGSGIRDGGEEDRYDTSGSHFDFDCYGWLLVIGWFRCFVIDVILVWFDELFDPDHSLLYTSFPFFSAIDNHRNI